MKRFVGLLLSSIMILEGCYSVMATEGTSTASVESAEAVSNATENNLQGDEITVKDEVVTGIALSPVINMNASSYTDGDFSYTLTGDNAYISGYTGGANVVIPATVGGHTVVGIGNSAFEDSTITSVVFPDTLVSIGTEAFRNCRSLTSVELPEGLTTLGGYAFSYCDALEEIILPDSITSSANYIFNKCTGLRKATINCKNIGEDTFAGCIALKDVEFGDKVATIGRWQFNGCSALENVSFSSSITSIGSFAFNDCTSLKSVSLNEGITAINQGAFENCKSLEEIEFPSTVKTLGTSVFSGCINLKMTILNEGVTSIEQNAFSGCVLLNDINIPSTVTEISWGAFENCTSLSAIVIGDGVKKLGNYAFRNCTALSDVEMNDKVTSIGQAAFQNCSSLQKLDIHSAITLIDDNTFTNSALTEFTIPDTVKKIDPNAFNGCVGLTKIDIPASVTDIGEYAFKGCVNLTEATFSNGLVNLNRGFDSCTALKSVVLPASLRSMVYAFNGCTALESATVNNDVVDMNNAFAGCTSLKEITIPASVTNATGVCGGCTSLTKATIDCAEVTGFNNCSSLSEVVFGNNVKTIGNNAFFGTTALKNLTLSNSITSIGQYAFRQSGLCSVKLNEGLTEIGLRAFADCKDLLNVVIPSTVNTIKSNAFTGMNTAVFEGVPPTDFSTTAFTKGDHDFAIFYKNPQDWSDTVSGYKCYQYKVGDPKLAVDYVDKDGFTISLTGPDVLYPIAKVAVWSDKNGKDDLKYYDAEIFYNSEAANSMTDNISVKTVDHFDNGGKYNIELYYGTRAGVIGNAVASTSCVVPDSNKVDTPIITKEAVDGGYSIALETELKDASIYYTTDGSEPSAESTLYTDKITLTQSTVVKAIAIKTGFDNSSVATESITIEKNATPIITTGEAAGGYLINIADSNGGKVYYSINGDAPTTLYTAPFVVYDNCIVKAIVVKAGCGNSDVSSLNVAFSENMPMLKIDDLSAYNGSFIDVPVVLEKNPGIAAFGFTVKYDNTKLTPVSFTAGDSYPTTISNIFEPNNLNSGLIMFQWDNLGNIDTDGTLVTVRFNTKNLAQDYTTNVDLSYTLGNICNLDLQNVSPRIDNGTINVKYVKKGDLTETGDISSRDILLVRKIIACFDGENTPDEIFAADVVPDGVVNNKDVLLIRKFVAGYNVSLEQEDN